MSRDADEVKAACDEVKAQAGSRVEGTTVEQVPA